VNGLAADRVLRVGAAHSMAGTGEVHRAVAVRGTKIVAVSPDPHGLDGLVGAATRVMDDPDLTLLPAFCDAHEHLLESAKNTALVPVGQARSIAEFTAAVGRAAAAAAEGQWVQTSIAWHESNLAEGRLPTRVELDAASPDHPVLARRGGHLAVANSAALGAAGITAATPDPPAAPSATATTASSTACWKARPSTGCWGTCRRPLPRRWSRGCGRRRPPTPPWASGRSGRR
jgi:predicted amidohydrolase YtcJ